MSAKTAMADVAPTVVHFSEIRGAAIPLEECRWSKEQQAANANLLLMLGELTGRLEPSGWGGYRERGDEAGWMRLADVDESAIEAVLARIRRNFPEWRFDAGAAETLLGKLDCHVATAVERRRRAAV